MLKRKLTTGDYLLIIANLIPVYGVWYEGWNASQIFLVYCLETVIIGLFNVIKMACVTLFIKPKDVWQNGSSSVLVSGFFFIAFFIVHYGFFVFVQTQIFFSVSGIINDHSTFMVYREIPRVLGDEGRLLLFIFISYYTLHTLFNFFLSGKYKVVSINQLMFQPYGRIFIQQFVVIVGSMFLTFGASKIFILILALVKIFFETYINFDRLIDKAAAEEKIKNNMEKNK